ncbi:MAG: phospholipase [Paludibacteraceae bacterium]|nr:phospholipase [Paludibacteraceae bacterium]
MLPLVLFIALGIVVLVATEIHERQQKTAASRGERSAQKPTARPEGCCGEHLVCERETLLQTNAKIEYYDDEELDALSGIAPDDYTEAQAEEVRTVFRSLREADIAGWCRSMQLRNISLPEDVREEALMIVRERRAG